MATRDRGGNKGVAIGKYGEACMFSYHGDTYN